jgi:hypothetical protein
VRRWREPAALWTGGVGEEARSGVDMGPLGGSATSEVSGPQPGAVRGRRQGPPVGW